MAGHHIVLLCIICLKVALQADVSCSKFKELKVFKETKYVLLRDELWQYLFTILLAMYAPAVYNVPFNW